MGTNHLFKGISFYFTARSYGLALACLFLLSSVTTGFSQTVVWSEDFDSYADSTLTGTGGSWTTNCPACGASNDWLAAYGGCMEARDVNDTAHFLTEWIDISSYGSVDFSFDISESGDLEGLCCSLYPSCTSCGVNTDFFTVCYRTSLGGAWSTISNWNNYGDATTTLYGDSLNGTYGGGTNGLPGDADFGSQSITETGITGDSLQIWMKFKTTAADEYMCMDNLQVYSACADGDPPYIMGSSNTDTSSYVSDSTFRVMLSEPINCSTINLTDFLLDCSSTTTPALCSANSVINVGCYNEATWSGGIDTSRWIEVEIANPSPIWYQDDWKFVVTGSGASLADTCGNIIDSTGSGGATGQAVILPIELLSFTATLIPGNMVETKWVTASENNNEYFTVERTVDGESFEEVGIIRSKGASTSTQSYKLIDEEPYPGQSYYRLKQTDFDGTETFSSVVSIYIKPEELFIGSVYPIPAHDFLFINAFSPLPGQGTLQIYDILGKQMLVQNTTLTEGNNTLKLNVESLDPGIYLLQIESGDQTFLKKIVKE